MSRLLVVLAAGTALLFFDFGSRILTTNDEVRFPLLARDILTQGHWLLPRLNDSPHLDKPPLEAWLIALASWPGEAVTQGSAALPSLLAALGVVLATFWIGWQLFGVDAAVMAGLIAVTMYGLLTLARAPTPDMTLCAPLTAAMAAYMTAEFDHRSLWLIAFYGLVRVAVWAKGPVGLLPLAVVVLDTVATYGWAGPARLASTPGLVLFAALLAPWWAVAVGAAGASGSGSTSRETIGSSGTSRATGGVGAWSWKPSPRHSPSCWSPLLPVACWWATHS